METGSNSKYDIEQAKPCAAHFLEIDLPDGDAERLMTFVPVDPGSGPPSDGYQTNDLRRLDALLMP